MSDVLITPASGLIEFKDANNNVDATIELQPSGDLEISAPGGDIIIGDTTSDLYIGDGINSVDMIFEQSGSIRGTGSQTITLGVSGDTIFIPAGVNFDVSDAIDISSGDLTVNGDIIVTGTVDGRDVAADGTKLDGIETGATADQTASEILTAIKTVDGTGSGLDADTVDGIQAERIIYGDTSKGTLDGRSDLNDFNKSGFYWTSSANNKPSTDNGTTFHINHDTSDTWATQLFLGHNAGDSYFRGKDTGVWGDWIEIWTDNNHGSGSGLDADLWDGNQFASYLNQAVLTTSSPTFVGVTANTIAVGDGTQASTITVNKATGGSAEQIIFSHGGTRMGEIGTQDTTFLRINQVTNKPIYTPRYIRADLGFDVDGSLVIDGNGVHTGDGSGLTNVLDLYTDEDHDYANTAPNEYPSGLSATRLYAATTNAWPLSYGFALTLKGSSNDVGQFILPWHSNAQGQLFYRYNRDGDNDWTSGGVANTFHQFMMIANTGDVISTKTGNSVKFSDDLETQNVGVTGNITVSGTVDGRDVAADGTKLDGIEDGATADQSASEILTAIKTVDGTGSGLDADLLDGQEGTYYLDWTNVTNKPDPTITLGGDLSGSITLTDLAGGTLTATVTNDSHTHTFNNLTSKTGGTGEYSTSSHLTSGRGSGGVSLTINDGYGNANITFNHKSGTPEQNGNAARIEVNTDSTSDANMNFEFKSNVTASTPVSLTTAANFSETDQKLYYSGSEKFATTSTGISITGNIVVSGTVDGRDIATDGTKLDTIETNADVTDATNVDAAGAVMNTDTSTAAMSFVIDEDTMATNSATKVPTQQSVKAYVDTTAAVNYSTVQAAGALMDDELTSEASVKAIDQGLATTDTPTFAGLNSTGTVDINNGTYLRWKDSGGTDRSIMSVDSANNIVIRGVSGSEFISFEASSTSEIATLYDDGNVHYFTLGNTTSGSRGELVLYGRNTGTAHGGRIALHLADDYDTTIEHFYIAANQDDFVVRRSNDAANLLKIEGDTLDAYLTANLNVTSSITAGGLGVGVDDDTNGIITVYGAGTGQTFGGRIVLNFAADYDTTAEGIKLVANEDDLWIRTTTDTDLFKIESDTKDVYMYADLDVSSGGITFNSGTDLLDTYISDSWTPVIADAASGGNVSGSYTVQTGIYTRIGNIVIAQFKITNASTAGLTSGNDLYIRGFPVAAASGNARDGFGSVRVSQTTFAGYLTLELANGTTAARLREVISGGTGDLVTVGEVTSGTSDYYGTIVYRV